MSFLIEGVQALTWQQVVMYAVGILLIYLAIEKDYEPSLLLPMGFGAILVNLPFTGVLDQTLQGGIQALSRSYFGQLIPPERSGEYFGFMDIFGKFACVIGPALYELFYGLTGKACFGILSIILLFILGFLFLTVGRKHFKVAEHAAIDG